MPLFFVPQPTSFLSVSSTGTDTTTAGGYTNVSGMQLAVLPGTYLVLFTGNGRTSAVPKKAFFAIKGTTGAAIAASVRQIGHTTNTPFCCVALVTTAVPGTINGQFKGDPGGGPPPTTTFEIGTLSAIRIG